MEEITKDIIPERAPDQPELPEQEPETPEEARESIADKTRIISPARLVVKRFFRSKLSIIGLCMFIFLLIFSFLGPLFVPWGESEADRSGGETMYTIISIETEINGEDVIVYSVEEYTPEMNVHADPFTYSHEGENSRLHVFGTDENGRDIFVRLMYGGRLSLMLSFLVVIIYTVIGIILGGLAGYFGKWVDMIIMRIVDILNCIPSLPILLIVGAIYDGIDGDPSLRIYFMLGILSLLSWTGVARLVRGQILFLREQEYIVAAEALGMGPMRKIFHHLIPNVMPQLIVSMTLGLGSIILYEATLSFLGLGVAPDMASWGQMVQRATQNTDILSYYVMDWLPAGIMIILAVLSFNFIGDGLRDALDPKMKR